MSIFSRSAQSRGFEKWREFGSSEFRSNLFAPNLLYDPGIRLGKHPKAADQYRLFKTVEPRQAHC
jgi:hypothetical protein